MSIRVAKEAGKTLLKFAAIYMLLALLFSIFLFNVTFPVQFEMTALEIIYNNPDHVVSRAVTVNGQYRFNLFANYNLFSGFMQISGYPE